MVHRSINIARERFNQDQKCLVKIVEYIGFDVMRGPDYYAPPVYGASVARKYG